MRQILSEEVGRSKERGGSFASTAQSIWCVRCGRSRQQKQCPDDSTGGSHRPCSLVPCDVHNLRYPRNLLASVFSSISLGSVSWVLGYVPRGCARGCNGQQHAPGGHRRPRTARGRGGSAITRGLYNPLTCNCEETRGVEALFKSFRAMFQSALDARR